MTTSNNTTEMALVNVSESVYFHSGAIGFQLSLCIVEETLGNFMLLAVILYEMHGMNPQKRTVYNQLLSSICAVLILFNLIIVPVWCVSRFGAYQSIAPKILIVFGVHAMLLFCTLASTEMVIVKLLYIFHFSTISQANENTITLLLTIFNALFVSICLLIRVISGEYLHSPWTSSPNTVPTSFHKKINFFTAWLPALVCFTIVALGLPIILFKKWRAKHLPTGTIPMSNINTPAPQEAQEEAVSNAIEEPVPGPVPEVEALDAQSLASKSNIIFVKPINIDESETEGPQGLEPSAISITIEEEETEVQQQAIASNDQEVTEPQPQEEQNNFNENLISYGALIFLYVSIAAVLIPIVLVAQFDLEMIEFMKLLIFVMYNILTIGLPLLFFVQKPRRLDSILELCQ